MSNECVLEDPRQKYLKPEFPTEKQSLPGVEKAMRPSADHGEESYRGSGKLEGRSVLITGGDSGIGRAIAIAYAREGADVAFTYLEESEDAEVTSQWILKANRKALAIRMDQSNSDECEKAINATLKAHGKLDILINNAAEQKAYESLLEVPDSDIEHVFKTNIESIFYLCRNSIAQMPCGSSIINTTSIQAFDPSPQLSPYAATKAAIANFTVSLAKEAIHKGIRVNAVAPGPVWTPLIPASVSEEKLKNFGANTLFERPAQPAELAPLYVFLASNDASYITGEIYGVTGGRMQL